MSTEHDFRIGSVQYNWLLADLKAVNRSITPWLIFCGHRPMYINSYYGGAFSSDIVVADLMRKNLEPLFVKYKVNLGVYGTFKDVVYTIIKIIIQLFLELCVHSVSYSSINCTLLVLVLISKESSAYTEYIYYVLNINNRSRSLVSTTLGSL